MRPMKGAPPREKPPEMSEDEVTPSTLNSLPRGPLNLGRLEDGSPAEFDPRDLTTHVLIAGDRGAGKTTAAQILASEVNKAGVPVAVFDPDGGWFEIPGAHVEVLEEPEFTIDFSTIPYRLSVFDLGEIPYKRYDAALKSVVDSLMVETRWEESSTLRMLVVLEETHRTLPRYGGRGGGYYGLERAVRELRKWGVGVVMVTEFMAEFKDELGANVLTEIQLKTTYELDLRRARDRFGPDYATTLPTASPGEAFVHNPRYNRGQPYRVHLSI